MYRYLLSICVLSYLLVSPIQAQIKFVDFYGSTHLLGKNEIIYPNDIFPSDIDNDGDIDIVSGGGNGLNRVYLHLNNGDGTFQTPEIVDNKPGNISELYLVDIDDDNFDDLFTLEFNSLRLYRNNGNGSFDSPSTIYSDIQSGAGLHLSDLNGDNTLDILTASSFDNIISWHSNAGDGVFGTRDTISSSENRVTSVYSADLDNDGDEDVIATSLQFGSVSWYKNNGSGIFEAPIVLTDNASQPSTVKAFDMDSDNDFDIIVTLNFPGRVLLIENIGNGEFKDPKIIAENAPFAQDLTIADFNADGHPDIAFSSTFDAGVAVIINQGNLNFDDQINVDFKSRTTQSIISADFNNDGRIDLATATPRSDLITWYENITDSTFSLPLVIASSTNSEPFQLVVNDFDNNGTEDIFVTNYESENTLLYKNEGEGNILSPNSIADEFPLLESYKFIDLDGDSLKDLVTIGKYTVDNYERNLAWFKNSNNTSFINPSIILSIPGEVNFDLGDLDRDGDPDITLTSRDSNQLIWFKNSNGSFGEGALISEEISSVSDVRLFDVNNDSLLDIITYSFQNAVLQVFLNQGSEVFPSTPDITVPNIDIVDYALTDLDNDNNIDIIVAGVENSRIYEIVDEEIGEPLLIPSLDFVRLQQIDLSDIDNDGDEDIVAVYSFSGIVVVRNLNGSFGELEFVVRDTDYFSIRNISSSDVNGDSYPDIVFTSSVHNQVGWIENIIPLINSNEINKGIPSKLNLSQNYPNPFNPNTTIKYEISEASNIKLSVFDLLGREILVLVNEKRSAGVYSVTFDASNLSSGTYIYRIESNSQTVSRKLTLIK